MTLRANEAFDSAPPLSRARAMMRLRDGREWSQAADGARGYPGRLTEQELASKFADCARRTLTPSAVERTWTALANLESSSDVRALTRLLSPG